MNESVRMKRGLVRFDRTTVEELAQFAAAKSSMVHDFLNTQGLCTKECLPADGREGPKTIWILTHDGREKLLSDLRRVSSVSDPELERERLDGLQRIQQGIVELEQMIGELETSKERLDRRRRAKTRARERLYALSAGLRNLQVWRLQPIEHLHLSHLNERLEHLGI